MYKRIVWSLALLVSIFVAVALFAAQNVSVAQSDEAVHARRSIAINLLRAINTAEYQYKFKRGRFADWDALLESEEFAGRAMQGAARNDSQLAGTHLSKCPDILPGWRLRMNVHADEQGYDVMLEDATDNSFGWAAITDERAVIRESKSI